MAGQRTQHEIFQASSYYPGRGDNTHALASINDSSIFYTPDVDDDGDQSEEDPLDDELPTDDAQKHLNKFSESLLIEVSLRT